MATRDENKKTHSKRSEIRRKKRRKKRIIIFTLLFLVLALIAAGVIYGYMIINGLTITDLTGDRSSLGISDDVQEQEGITNVALFGIDTRDGSQTRSDTIIIVTVDHIHNKVKLSSVMRDSYVEVDGVMTKINSAYQKGGPLLAIKTLNENFGLDISEYASVDFGSMAEIIDAVGGIDMYVSEEELPVLNQCVKEQAVATGAEATLLETYGDVHLNGIQAVGYARIRSVGLYDYERTDRQRRVLEQLFEKALTMSKLDYPEMLRKLLPLVETSMGFDQILSEAWILLNDPQFYQMRFPMDKDLTENHGRLIINGIEYVGLDIEATAEHMQQYIFFDIEPLLVLDEIDAMYTEGR